MLNSFPMVPATRHSSLGDRAFAVAGPRAWNSLPQFVSDCSSPLTVSPSRNISRLIYLVYLFRAQIILLTVQSTLVVA